jgi:hypothetical protein
MSLETCEACQKPETACDCLGPRSLACDFCGKGFQKGDAFYESRAFRVLEGGPDECGCDSAVLSCERCEVIRMRAAKWFGRVVRWFRGRRSMTA